MNTLPNAGSPSEHERYARCIASSKRVRWDIDEDVIRGRVFDTSEKFLPDGLSLVDRLDFLSSDEQRYLSQIQGRTYANMFGLVERFINAKVLEVSRDHWFGDQTKLEALIRFSDEELKHQALFRRIEALAAEQMPEGYVFAPDPNEVADVVLAKSTWAVLGLTLLIELFTQQHYRESIEPDGELSALFKDIFLFHWKEESQHAIMDELEWERHDASMTPEARDKAVDEFIELAVAVDGILQAQSASDAEYFGMTCGRALSGEELEAVKAGVLKAYRYQYILSGAEHPQFLKVLVGLITEQQAERIQAAVASLR
ncbi:MAG: hypothetical protein PVH89_13755 [Gammaproteobacteria bacterium]|jgi:hypothetical protein